MLIDKYYNYCGFYMVIYSVASARIFQTNYHEHSTIIIYCLKVIQIVRILILMRPKNV